MQNKSLSSSSIKRFRNLLVAAAIMTFLLIVMGGIVRVTGSGLGCPDWPKCFGKWIPPLRTDAIIEYMHRLFATLTSPLILASAVIAWRNYRHHKSIYRPLLWAVGLLGVQGLLGGIVVLLETPPDLVAVHLGNALLILGLIILPSVVAYTLDKDKSNPTHLDFSAPLAKALLWLLIAIFVVLVSGAIVAGSNATESCPGWPLCNGVLFPSNLPAWIHMIHRFLVAALTIWTLYLFKRIIYDLTIPSNIKYSYMVFITLFFAQALIGAIKVTTNFPVIMLGLHVANAAAVWAAAVVLTTLAALRSNTA